MKTLQELDDILQSLYWKVEHGEHKRGIMVLRELQIEALHYAASICPSCCKTVELVISELKSNP